VGRSADDLALVSRTLAELEAERVGLQTLQANAAAQRTLTDLLRRERRDLTPGLRPLAQRTGLAA
jgi:hypothetical protein